MTDSEFNQIRTYVYSICKEWIRLTGLSWENITILWSREHFNEEKDGHPYDCVATCTANWRYLDATITFSVPKLLNYFHPDPKRPKSLIPKDPSEIRYIVIHELMHIHLNELRVSNNSQAETQLSHEERVSTRLARAFAYTWDQGIAHSPNKRSRPRSHK